MIRKEHETSQKTRLFLEQFEELVLKTLTDSDEIVQVNVKLCENDFLEIFNFRFTGEGFKA